MTELLEIVNAVFAGFTSLVGNVVESLTSVFGAVTGSID